MLCQPGSQLGTYLVLKLYYDLINKVYLHFCFSIIIMNIVLPVITGLPVADVGASAVVGTTVFDEISLVTVLFGCSAVVGTSVSALVSVSVEVEGASVDFRSLVLVISPVVVVGDIASVVSLAINKKF